ncbi:hypothetical protein DPMN_095696 [Dreissena polymorpha]|uniref:Uncharacterized protein n=1 Tax=Dreissena polymorpha TaxID=45954 RepID=A0A9D4L8G6_DREPO|nr:hypothetical protein DPMN_095696 [Dreissena polymorpha]
MPRWLPVLSRTSRERCKSQVTWFDVAYCKRKTFTLAFDLRNGGRFYSSHMKRQQMLCSLIPMTLFCDSTNELIKM